MHNVYIKFPTSDKTSIVKVELDKDFLDKFKKNERQVIVDMGQFQEVGKITNIKKYDEKEKIKPCQELCDGKIIRLATEEDKEKIDKLKKEAQEYLPKCREKIEKYGYAMRLFDADLSFDEKKLTFYFGAENRIDFRLLVLDLIKTFKKTIRLQQIGSRDQARKCGGFGFCGRELCCKKFLNNTEGVTLDCAKAQDLIGNVGKISGMCGKLMCCLEYEAEEYTRVKNKLPKIGTKLKTKNDDAIVVGYNIFNESVIVEMKKDRRKVEIKV